MKLLPSARRFPILFRVVVGSAAAVLAAGCHASAPGRATISAPTRMNVGYAEIDPRDRTGAISSISEKGLAEIREGTGRLEDVLQSRVPGPDVQRLRDGTFSLRIRGARSLIGNNDPLILVDGMPLSASALSLIPPGSVGRIDVLKDAGSTGAYGSRGANGVILITTRRAPPTRP